MSNIYLAYDLGGKDGVFPEREAVELMTDEWINGGNYCEQTLMDTRDALKSAQHRMHWTALWVGLGSFVLGFATCATILALL